MEESVLILMTSYNGEKYIAKQIQSIICQTYKNWTLWIQDDDSTDGTRDIVRKYMSKDHRIKLTSNKGIHGPYYNFHSLVNKAKMMDIYDYYMFCDHDDIWFSDKIEKMVEVAGAFDSNTPTMVYANMRIIDGKDEIIEDDLNKKMMLKYKGHWDLFFNHQVYGCNSLFNYALFKIVPKVDVSKNRDIVSILCHDNYYAKFAEMYGKLIFFDEVTMSYRRYGKNVTAAHNYNYDINRILKRLRNIDLLAKDHARTYSQSIYTIDLMLKQQRTTSSYEDMNKNLNEIRNSLLQGGYHACRCFFKYRISCGAKIRTFSRFAILVSGIYKKYLVN